MTNAFIYGLKVRLIPTRLVGVIFRDDVLMAEHEPSEHAQNWMNRIKPNCEQGLRELADALENNRPIILTHSPVRFLREVQEDGSDMFLGDVGLFRCPDIQLENPKHDLATNRALPAGHPDIIWSIGGIFTIFFTCEIVRLILSRRFSCPQSSSERYNDGRS